tara:strand:- start:6348 stop:6782 length:435 start_codon:yes stop_codon:yes gene_type:complete
LKNIKRQVLVICVANYCRSPVAEYILKNLHEDKFIILSAGIMPKYSHSMDPRSLNYLRNKGINLVNHVPRKVDSKLMKESDIILCLDHFVLSMLNKDYAKYADKIKLITYQNKEINIEDPYKHDEKKYIECMEKINKVCSNLDI